MSLRYRQVHLDFHTSEQIPGVGSEFDPNEFAETLKKAHVNSITCFSRCHHGMIYHDTEKFPERRHPHLSCNLLKEQIEACHKRDIKVPIYITVQWDYFTAKQHPEWLRIDENGVVSGTKPFEAGFYKQLCVNSPYIDFLEAQTKEVCSMFDTDGIFFDICMVNPCCCQYCLEEMRSVKLDPSNANDRMKFAITTIERFQDRLYGVVKGLQPNATVFFNMGHIGPGNRNRLHTYTHLELESLPSGGWGYMHFPTTQRYARTLDKPTLGMTGKFHTSWGDFQSFKNPEALEYECMNMLALGARCSVGDQLHPNGRLSKGTYDLIGSVYAKVKALEPYCDGSKPVAEIAVLTPESFTIGGDPFSCSSSAFGAVRILQELQCQFDVVDTQSDYSPYRIIILPDDIPVDGEFKTSLSRYIENGGAVIASYKSGLSSSGSGFNLIELGIEDEGDAPYCPDYILPGCLSDEMANEPHVMYIQGRKVNPLEGTETLCEIVAPYFNRTWEHFCSHRHTPPNDKTDYPGVVQHGKCIYFSHPIFSLYNEKAPLWCKRLLRGALKRLLPNPLVEVSGPSTLVVSLNEQPKQKRTTVFMTNYIPERRCQFDIIEDIIPLYNLKVKLKTAQKPSKVLILPDNSEIDVRYENGYATFIVPKMTGYSVAVIEGSV